MKKLVLFFLCLGSLHLRSQNLSTSLTACYALDGSAAEPINGLTGTLSAVTATVDRFSNPNSAYYFSGSSSSYIKLPDDPLLKPSNAISFACWVKPTVTTDGYILYTRNSLGSSFEAYNLCIAPHNGGYYFMSNKSAPGGYNIVFSSSPISVNTWQHLVTTMDNSSIKLYVNGVLDGTTAVTFNGFDYVSGKNVYLGSTNETSYNAPYFGLIDNARFYNRVLTATEIGLLYSTDPACTTTTTAMVGPVASFNAPDTVCVNQTFTVQNTSTGTISSYYWNSCASTLSIPSQTYNSGAISALSAPVFLSINKDGTNYYMFVANNNPGSLARLSYGSSLNNTPVISNLGTLGGNIPINPEGIWIEKEGSTWYGIFLGGPSGSERITRLNFGNSLANTPTVTNMGNIGSMDYPHRIQVFRTGGNVYAYTANRGNNSITRFDFGNSIANVPSGTNLGNIGSMNLPSDFSIINYNSNWYAYVCNDGNGTLSRIDFGNSLLNTPTGVNIGNTGGLGAPRAIAVWVECNAIKGVVHDRFSNVMFNMNFSSGPTGLISTTSLGNIANFDFPHGLQRYRVGDSLATFLVNVNTNSLSRIDYPTCNAIPSSTLQNPAAMTFTAPGTYTLNLVCNEGLYDQSAYCKVIHVSNVPVISATASSSNICAGYSVTLTANGANTYTWQPGNISGGQIIVAPNSTTIYTVTGINASGCSSSATVSVLVNSNFSISVLASPPAICAGGTSTLFANGANTYTWLPGNFSGSTVAVSPAASLVYTVTGAGNAGCVSSTTLSLIVTSNPSISASASPSIVCSGNSSSLTAGGGTSYTWQPGNLTGSMVVVNPVSPTVYTVTGAIGSCTAMNTVAVAIGLNAQINSSGSLCNNNTIDLFISPPSPNYVLSWSGPGILGSPTTPTVTINAGGIYSVSATNTLTGCSGTASLNVFSSNNPISLNITPSYTTACFPGPPVNILVNVSANLTWFPPAEVTPNTGPLVSVSPSVTSTYTVLASLGSCTGSAVVTISVNNTPTVSVAAKSLSLCSGSVGHLDANGASAYDWEPGNLSGPSVTVSPVFSTQYTVTGSNGNCTSSEIVSVTVIPSPFLITSASPNTVCIGNSSTLTANGASLYSWSAGSVVVNSPSVVVSPSVSTIYTVAGTNDAGCISGATLGITVINSPAISAISSATSICSGETITLTSSGAATYTWFPGFLSGNTVVSSPTVSTTYTVLSGNSLCSYATVLVIVNNCKSIALGVTNAAEQPMLYGSSFYKIRFTITVLNNSGSNLNQVVLTDELKKTFLPPASYTLVGFPQITSQNSALTINPFFDGDLNPDIVRGSSSTLSANKRDTISFELLLDPKGFYGLVKNSVIGTAVDKNAIFLSDSSNNGFAWDPDNDGDPTNNNEITPINIQLLDLFIPEGFSPNSDGINDKFIIGGLNNRKIKLMVFNRWGTKIYEKSNYDNSWDGTVNTGGVTFGNGKVPEGTYYYVIQFLDGNKESKNGFVVVWY